MRKRFLLSTGLSLVLLLGLVACDDGEDPVDEPAEEETLDEEPEEEETPDEDEDDEETEEPEEEETE